MINEEIIAQLKASQDVTKILNLMSYGISQRYQKIVQATYDDPEIRSLYNGLRTESQVTKKKVHRKIISFPNAYVLHFLDDLFKVKYGDNWMKDRKTLIKVIKNEDLMKPWTTVDIKTL